MAEDTRITYEDKLKPKRSITGDVVWGPRPKSLADKKGWVPTDTMKKTPEPTPTPEPTSPKKVVDRFKPWQYEND